jgi:hypothetical protein
MTLKTLTHINNRPVIMEVGMANLKVKIIDIHEGDAHYVNRDYLLNEIFTLDEKSISESKLFEGDWKFGRAYDSKEDGYLFAGFKYEEITS